MGKLITQIRASLELELKVVPSRDGSKGIKGRFIPVDVLSLEFCEGFKMVKNEWGFNLLIQGLKGKNMKIFGLLDILVENFLTGWVFFNANAFQRLNV